MDQSTKYYVRKVILDFVCLLIVSLPILFLKVLGQPFKRGFFCDDESLMHPYHDSTVTNPMLYIIGLGLPIITILVTEYIHFNQSQKQMVIGTRSVSPWMWNSYKTIGVFGFCVACSQLTTDIAKYTIGRLRPHFFDACKPNVDCNLLENKNRYIEDFTCQNTDPYKVKDSRLSFPSGHSSFSVCSMLFLAFYIQARVTWHGSKLLKHLLQFICLMLAWLTALSRISNYKHHWSDVLIGCIQGAIVCVLVVVFVSDLFKPQKPMPPLTTKDIEIDASQTANNRIL